MGILKKFIDGNARLVVLPPSRKSREKFLNPFVQLQILTIGPPGNSLEGLLTVCRRGVEFGLSEGILAKFLGSALWSKTLHVLVLLSTLEEFEMTGFGGEETFGGWGEAGAVFLFCY